MTHRIGIGIGTANPGPMARRCVRTSDVADARRQGFCEALEAVLALLAVCGVLVVLWTVGP